MPGKQRNEQQRVDVGDMVANHHRRPYGFDRRIDTPRLQGHDHPAQQEKAAIKKMVEPLKGPRPVACHSRGQQVKGRKEHHEAGRKIDPQQQRGQQIDGRPPPALGRRQAGGVGGAGLMLRLPDDQAGVDPAEGKILDGGESGLGLGSLPHVAEHGAALIHLVQVQGGGDKALLHHIEGQDRFDDPAGAHGVAHIAFQAGDPGALGRTFCRWPGLRSRRPSWWPWHGR